MTTSCVRSRASNFERIRLTWDFAVATLMFSSAAISALDIPPHAGRTYFDFDCEFECLGLGLVRVCEPSAMTICAARCPSAKDPHHRVLRPYRPNRAGAMISAWDRLT